MVELSWDSAGADWDARVAQRGVHHEQPAGTDWASASEIELGQESFDSGGTALQGYWPLNEDTGTTATDVSGNANHGTIGNGVTMGHPGPNGMTCYDFDGIDDYVRTTNITAINGSAFTVMCWANLDVLPTSGNHTLIGKWDSWNDHIDLRLSGAVSSLTFAVQTGNVGEAVNYPYTSLSTQTWHHLAGVYDGSSTSTFYVDGTSVGSVAGPPSGPVTSRELYIGQLDGVKNYYDGQLADVQAYSRALSADEIAARADIFNGWLLTAAKPATAPA